MRAINIKWDTDGDEEILKTLPKEMDIPDDVDEENVADWLSDRDRFLCLWFCSGKQKGIGFSSGNRKKRQNETLKKSRTGLTC